MTPTGAIRRLIPRTVAGQMFALLVVMVLVLGAGAVAALVVQAGNNSEDVARVRALAVAETFSRAPGVLAALESPDPSARLQPITEVTRRETGVDYIVVTNTKGVRYTHPNPAEIGKSITGPLYPATAGRPFTDRVPGRTLPSPSIRAVAPVFDKKGSVVALVNAGVTIAGTSRTVNRQLPVLLGGGAAALALATVGVALMSRRLRRQTRGLEPAEITRMYEHHDAVLHAVREGVLIISDDGRLLLVNDEARRLLDLPPDVPLRDVADLGPRLDQALIRLLADGRVAADEVHRAAGRFLAVNQQPTRSDGRALGSVATLRDTTELRALAGRATEARETLMLLYDATVTIGTTLDLTRTAEELAQAALPRFADLATVDVFESVLEGAEPARERDELRRAAAAGVRGQRSLYQAGQTVSFHSSSPQARSLADGRSVLEQDLAEAFVGTDQDPAHTEWLRAHGMRSLITVPLRAGGWVLGVTSFYRGDRLDTFDEDDVSTAEELVGRAAVCLDNARRYAREHAMAVSLQRSLLPGDLPQQNAVEAAYRYIPARSGVGGDWFDVIPLSGARVALVVGDVVGHGLHAVATMGLLRTAVLNFSALDLAPDELLTHLDELVSRLDQEENHRGRERGAAATGGTGIIGATCLYAIYDPVSRRCTMARAGHPAPAIVRPDGTVDFPDVPGGPPLGLGGFPFEVIDLGIEENSEIVLYTDGLIENRRQEIDGGLERLEQALAHRGRSPEQTCDAVLDALLPADVADVSDDVALLVARTRTLDTDHFVVWDVPVDPAAVATARADVTRKLSSWGLDEAAFTTELIVSELVTNAIRHAIAPIHLRLVRDRGLICEVSDGSSTAPHLRRSTAGDEGGRGLFLVAQLTESWGTRYTSRGKTIWAEQVLPPAGDTEPDGPSQPHMTAGPDQAASR
ncbi:SpoIIE family protein phosphatase [Streptomyces niveus]|uniref:Histidine kinase n=1 Tax=Streptomyces niveus TaxID=193462 RepID=A0A1U9R2F3_STRNV|nr:SpoIIE family protein phosphatase [Streptomyces niveus]AQU70075.1 histidine kinase [Streptomyces niveus]